MKEIKSTIITEQTIYEITKDELDAIKRNERAEGRMDVAMYLSFAIKHYYCELNLFGVTSLLGDIVDFLCEKTNTIRNTYGYSFGEYIRKYR